MNSPGKASITILLCERPMAVPAGDTLYALRERVYPGADVTVYNGAPAESDQPLREGDSVVFIRRGEIPSPADLETLMAARHTPGVHAVLRRSCVGIAGLGGLGSAVAVALARIGVGRLVLADFDVVEPSNLNRQQYFMGQIGLRKTDALRENLLRIHPCVDVESHAVRVRPDNIQSLFGKVNVLVEAFDRAEEKAMLIENALGRLPDIPIVAASGLAGHHASNSIRTRRIGSRLYLCGDGESAARPGTGLMAPRVGIAAHHQANAVLRLLLGENPAD